MFGAQGKDRHIETWRIKKLIQFLEAANGTGKNKISMIIPPHEQIYRVQEMLNDKYHFASNIKSNADRSSAEGAIWEAQNVLRRYGKAPPNGLVLYAGFITTGGRQMFKICLEPFKPMNASLFLCYNKFHTEILDQLLESIETVGFIIVDDNGTLFGTLSGNKRNVLHEFTADLPKKKIAELASHYFIDPSTSQPNIVGLILGGTAYDFKTGLSQSDEFDPRLQAKIINVIDVSYGGESGFRQAIELSSEILENVKFMHEKKLIGKLFEEIIQDTGKYVVGVDDVMKALKMGAIETLIVWEYLDISIHMYKNLATGELVTKYLNNDQEADQSTSQDSDKYAEFKKYVVNCLVQRLVSESKKVGFSLEFVTNKSLEGSQFCSVFGGIGGILRYQLDRRSFNENSLMETFDYINRKFPRDPNNY